MTRRPETDGPSQLGPVAGRGDPGGTLGDGLLDEMSGSRFHRRGPFVESAEQVLVDDVGGVGDENALTRMMREH
jgi:hypothetical protein